MKYLLLILVLMLTGCGGMTAPVLAGPGDNADTWPIAFLTDNAGPDNFYTVFYDQGAVAWDAPRLTCNDSLDEQWIPQRNCWGWDTAGKWGVALVETTSNDLEYWESPDSDWQDEAGAWALTDDDATSNYTAVDIEVRQDYIWAGVFIGGTTVISNYYLNLGSPNWTKNPSTPTDQGNDNDRYSIVLDDNLAGATHFILINTTLKHAPVTHLGLWNLTATGQTLDYPQIIVDGENRLWVFGTTANIFSYIFAFDSLYSTVWEPLPAALYTATTLSSAYHATWLAADDTIHVVVVNFNGAGNTTLNYLRRTPNGWSSAVVLKTVDSTILGARDSIICPQITVDPIGSILVGYISVPDWTAGAWGDVQVFYLDSTLYSGYATAANWANTTDIDAGANDVTAIIMPDSIPINSDM